jgi:hypothetical protein
MVHSFPKQYTDHTHYASIILPAHQNTSVKNMIIKEAAP